MVFNNIINEIGLKNREKFILIKMSNLEKNLSPHEWIFWIFKDIKWKELSLKIDVRWIRSIKNGQVIGDTGIDLIIRIL